MDKSYVTMEQHKCPICGKDFDTGAILLDKRLQNSFEKYTITGTSICPECQAVIDKGTTALIEVRDGETGKNPYRTGNIYFIDRKEALIMYIEESTAKELGLHD